MVTLTTADKALKTVYLDVLSNQLNTKINPFLAKIKSSTKDVWGKEVKKLAPIGINGGIAAGTEDGDMPAASANQYLNFTSSLKNLYGTIEITDKAIRASQNNSGAFVDLLNDEMDGLVKAAQFNFGRMLYGDGSGLLGSVSSGNTSTQYFVLDTKAKNVIEGMLVDIYQPYVAAVGQTPAIPEAKVATVRVTAIDRSDSFKIYYSTTDTISSFSGLVAYASGSKGNELTGLGAIFDTSASIYGVARTSGNYFLKPYIKSSSTISDAVIQECIDAVEEATGSVVDTIITTPGVRRKYLDYLNTNKRSVNTTTLDGGFSAITYNGIPMLVDRFCPEGTMYLLNSKSFTIHQLCDWRWLEDDNGSILKQKTGKAAYSATLVKYAELICDMPGGQAKIYGITE